MLVKLGSRTVTEDVVDLLIACHERIRTFIAMATRITADAGPDAREAAGQVRRYFAEAFPLHVADEEELLPIPPRIHDDHVAHAPAIDRLVAMCAAVEQGGPVPAELAPLAEQLERELTEHLAIEERDVFPALRALPEAERTRIRDAIRARRAR
ncbi:MAG: hemerythrin domain-containing protein [Deltaproteobacteria bacterium]|nr:hemerythrin domain-containing protein [Deltaproteobacteria bacterium]